MTEPKHTPGPWREDGEDIVGDSKTQDEGICTIITHGYLARGLPTPEDAANARLIAAAPDLLAALERAPIIRLGESLDEFRERYSRWYREVRNAAIAKATGTTTEG